MNLIKFSSKHNVKDKESIEKDIFNLLNTDVSLRSKRELIEKFIQESLPNIVDSDNIPEEFQKFWNTEQEKAMQELVNHENLHFEKTEKLIENYLFTEREPLRDELLNLRKDGKPSVLKFKETGDRILNKIKEINDALQAIAMPSEETVTRATKMIENILMTDIKIAHNPMVRAIKCGAARVAQVLQIVGPIGHRTDVDGKIYQPAITRGYGHGMITLHLVKNISQLLDRKENTSHL